MKKIIFLVCCLTFLSTNSILSQTLLWTSPLLTNGTVYSDWFVLQNNPLELRFYTLDDISNELKIMDGALSSTPLLETTLEPSESFSNDLSFDYSGDGLNDLIIFRGYSSPTFRYGLRLIDVSNGQTLFTFDDDTYSYYYEYGLPADINEDGKTEIVIRRSDLNYTEYQYLIYTTNGIPSSLNSQLQNSPESFQMNQNFPNPFNPTTTIRYSIPSQEKIIVRIYDVSGQLVKEITKEHNQAGEYEVSWDGTNNFGENVSSGAYFYQLIVGDYKDAKKMVLLK